MKNKTVSLVIFIAIVLAGIVIVAQTIRNNQALKDSEAAGFGSSATSTNYLKVENNLANTDCKNFITQDDINSSPSFFKTSQYIVTRKDKEILLPVNCVYELDGGKKITLQIHSYNADSYIDLSSDALYDRVNGKTMVTYLDNGAEVSRGNMVFMGQDKDNASICRSNVFHPVNDFEYADLSYEGFGDCSKLIDYNRIISNNLGLVLDNIVNTK